MLSSMKPLLLGAAIALWGAGCADQTAQPHADGHHSVIRAADVGNDVKHAVAVIHGTQGHEKVMGVVHFTDTGGGVKVAAHITGLAPNSEHGFHIHEFGDCTDPKGLSTGGHYNPDGHQHGHAGKAASHVGDMGNIKADANGMAHAEVTLPDATLSGKNAILGRGVIVHADPDKFTQPSGDAGGRIACGVIGIAK